MQQTKTATVLIRRLANLENVPLPKYMTAHASGMDVFAANKSKIVIEPQNYALIPAGFAIALPEGFEAQIRPRSGLALKHGVTVLNSPGTIDADYRGEVGVILINHGEEAFVVRRGDRIAQMIITNFAKAKFDLVEELPKTAREAGGFGSTGK